MADDTKFLVPIPLVDGCSLILSFLPGTDLDDVPFSLVRQEAIESLPEDTLEELKRIGEEIERIRSELRLITNPGQMQEVVALGLKLRLLERQQNWYIDESKKRVAQRLAQEAARHYGDYLGDRLEGLKKALPQTRHTDIGKFFAKQLCDRRYFGYSFNDLIPADVHRQINSSLQTKADSSYKEAIPSEFLRYVTYTWKAYLFALPCADYCLERGVPCLNFFFDLWAVLELELIEVEKAKDTFYGYELAISTHKQVLGTIYILFQPEPSYFFWQAIPLSLLHGLEEDQLIPAGAKVIGSSSNETIYEAEGFRIPIPDHFRSYLDEVGKKGGLEVLRIITPKTASIIEQLPSSEISTTCGADVEAAVTKLVELGWTLPDAKKATESTTFPAGATAEDIVRVILRQSRSKR